MKMITKQAIEDKCKRETRRYTFGPQKLVHDLNTGIQLSDLNLVLEGDIEQFIRGRIIARQWWYTSLIDWLCSHIAILYIYFFSDTYHTTSKDDLCKMYHISSQKAWHQVYKTPSAPSTTKFVVVGPARSKIWWEKSQDGWPGPSASAQRHVFRAECKETQVKYCELMDEHWLYWRDQKDSPMDWRAHIPIFYRANARDISWVNDHGLLCHKWFAQAPWLLGTSGHDCYQLAQRV